MRIIYKVGTGHDNIAGLTRLTTQPRCSGLNYAVWTPSAIGDVPQGKLSCKLLWDGGTTPAKLQAVLTQLGLAAAFNAAVTLTLPVDADRKIGFFNCYVSYPKQIAFHYFVSNPEIDVRIVEQIG